MDIKLNQTALKVSTSLVAALKQVMKQQVNQQDISQVTLNYRDTSYSSEAGGYHPVEIALSKDQESERWDLLYITDFSYYGYPLAELCKDLDFDFSAAQFTYVYSPPRPIHHHDVQEIFELWQGNFLSYLEYGAFDEIEVNAW